jgi:hypothetical protein
VTRSAFDSAERQRGAALLLLFFVLLVGSGLVLTAFLSGEDQRLARDRVTDLALRQAREALIGYAVSRGSSTGTARPGEFPCPATDEDGFEQDGCTGGQLGRIPWKTLGIPEPKDSAGETLWYSVSGPFRKRGAATTSYNNSPINSDTKALQTVYASDGQTLLTPLGSEAAVVILAPGAPLLTQQRLTAAQRSNPANYFESAGTLTNRNNAAGVGGGPYIISGLSPTFNDRVSFITTRDFIPLVERRVAAELVAALKAYRIANGAYPFPAKYSDANCGATGPSAYLSPCKSDATICRGKIPQFADVSAYSLPDWGGPAVLPDWFSYNVWDQVIYYAVGTDFLKTAPVGCSNRLQVDSITGIAGLIIMPGPPLGAITRPGVLLSSYLEDAANRDGWTGTAPAADMYVTPSPSSNDRLIVLPDS